MHAPKRSVAALFLILFAVAAPALSEPGESNGQSSPQDLKLLSIEELMQVDVTTAGRRPEPVGTTATAISVITGDDIRRSGVTTIADALRLADGVHVSRVNNGSWRVTARGFNGESPNKLLVMIDGRTVYSPLFAGAFWNMVDYPLEDIERIEVIRGPGGVLWGANAVNGIVNIITRHSRDTQGALVSVSTGNEHPAMVDARYGGTAGPATWRAYAKLAIRDDQVLASGAPSGDRIRGEQVGFRLDRSGGGAAWLLKGDLFHSRDNLLGRPPGEFRDVSLQGRWTKTFTDASRLEVQSYYRQEHRRIPLQLTHTIDVFDVDAQHSTTAGARHSLVWGAGARVNVDETEGSAVLQFDPADRTYNVLSVFAQDEIAVLPGRLFATIGAKYEYNSFSGGEIQPNVRARLLLPRTQAVWGAVSRAVRRPTRLDSDPLIFAPNGLVLVRGTHQFDAEKLTAYELGYRVQPVAAFSFEATWFRHHFDDLRSQDLPPAGGFPITIGNSLEGESTGIELGANVQLAEWWRTHVGYTWLTSEARRQAGSRDVTGGASEANDPDGLFNIRTSLELPRGLELDAMVRAIGELPNPRLPGYTELGVRLGWHATSAIDIWIVGQDLLHDAHPEAGPPVPTRVEFERSVRAGVTFRFGP